MKLQKEDVSGSLELLLEIVGEKEYLEIARMYGGTSIYIPTYPSAIRNARNREIAKRYNGVNAERLASEYKISVYHVKRILRREGIL